MDSGANSRQRSISRTLGRMGSPGRRNPGARASPANSPTVSATEQKTTIFDGTWQGEPRDTDSSGGGRVAARDRSTTDREDEVMGTRKRTAGRFQVEAPETRWTPGGSPSGVLVYGAACHIGEEIPQVQVDPLSDGGGMTGGFDHTSYGGRTGSGGEV